MGGQCYENGYRSGTKPEGSNDGDKIVSSSWIETARGGGRAQNEDKAKASEEIYQYFKLNFDDLCSNREHNGCQQGFTCKPTAILISKDAIDFKKICEPLKDDQGKSTGSFECHYEAEITDVNSAVSIKPAICHCYPENWEDELT
ncbi:MAG: hypothetical protein H6619_01995 [Deltaproteobacteria bacterium]|nr:hypothetical protein [Deltaproteobacteria bacterium]